MFRLSNTRFSEAINLNQIFLIGLGAIGSVYSELLQRAYPRAFRVIMDQARRRRLEENPLTVNGEVCSFDFAGDEVSPDPADVILVCVKTGDLNDAIQAMRPFVGDTTVILPLVNGVTAPKILRAAFPEANVLYGLCYVAAVRYGQNVYCKDPGKILFGREHNEPVSAQVERLQDILLNAGIPSEVPLDARYATWMKFMVNVAVNQVSAVLRATYGSLMSSLHAHKLLIGAAREVVSVANVCGVSLVESDISRLLNILSALPPDGKTSMLQDIEAGRDTEVEAFSGTVVSIGRLHGIPTPTNQILHDLLHALEEMPREVSWDKHPRVSFVEDLCSA